MTVSESTPSSSSSVLSPIAVAAAVLMLGNVGAGKTFLSALLSSNFVKFVPGVTAGSHTTSLQHEAVGKFIVADSPGSGGFRVDASEEEHKEDQPIQQALKLASQQVFIGVLNICSSRCPAGVPELVDQANRLGIHEDSILIIFNCEQASQQVNNLEELNEYKQEMKECVAGLGLSTKHVLFMPYLLESDHAEYRKRLWESINGLTPRAHTISRERSTPERLAHIQQEQFEQARVQREQQESRLAESRELLQSEGALHLLQQAAQEEEMRVNSAQLAERVRASHEAAQQLEEQRVRQQQEADQMARDRAENARKEQEKLDNTLVNIRCEQARGNPCTRVQQFTSKQCSNSPGGIPYWNCKKKRGDEHCPRVNGW